MKSLEAGQSSCPPYLSIVLTDTYEAYQQAVYRDGRNLTFWCSIGVLYFQINQYHDALDDQSLYL